MVLADEVGARVVAGLQRAELTQTAACTGSAPTRETVTTCSRPGSQEHATTACRSPTPLLPATAAVRALLLLLGAMAAGEVAAQMITYEMLGWQVAGRPLAVHDAARSRRATASPSTLTPTGPGTEATAAQRWSSGRASRTRSRTRSGPHTRESVAANRPPHSLCARRGPPRRAAFRSAGPTPPPPLPATTSTGQAQSWPT